MCARTYACLLAHFHLLQKKTSFVVTQDPSLIRNRSDNPCTTHCDSFFKWKSIKSSHRDAHTFSESYPQLEMPPMGPGSLQPSRSKRTHTHNTILPHRATYESPLLCTWLSHMMLLSSPFLEGSQISPELRSLALGPV